MKRLIFVIFLLACFSACKKEHVEPLSKSDEVNKLPQKVVTTGLNGPTTTIQVYTYNTQGLVVKISMYDSLTPNQKDSIVFSYNSQNKLSSKKTYFDNTLKQQMYTYNNQGKIETFQDYDTIHMYHYKSGGELDYIIRSNTTNTFKDSIQMYSDASWTYVDKGIVVLGSTQDYRYIRVEHFFNTENGVYADFGIWITPTPIWGDPVANTTVCIDKEIEFQNEVAYTIVPIGQAGYFNMYTRTTPYKYATYAEHLISPLLNTQHYEASYTFDIDGRLTFIDAEYLGPTDIGVLNPPSIPYAGKFTKTIYY